MKTNYRTFKVIVCPAVFLAALNLWAHGAFRQDTIQDYELVKKIVVAGNQAWTDTGLDVRRGQEFFFLATGTITLQKDNPVAGCGPDGLNLKTQQQPVPDQNLGALVGKILEKVEVATDKQTGEKTQKEIGQAFFIGKEMRLALSVDGHLLLGINELVIGDNDGSFEVTIYRKK